MPLINLKKIARYQVRKEDIPFDEFEDYLKDWWSTKYNLPPNHPLLLQLTLEELIVEYYKDIFARDPKELESFEKEIGEESESSDEAWFRKEMGGEYVDEYAYSDKFNKDLKKGKVDDNIDDTKEFEDNYQALGDS